MEVGPRGIGGGFKHRLLPALGTPTAVRRAVASEPPSGSDAAGRGDLPAGPAWSRFSPSSTGTSPITGSGAVWGSGQENIPASLAALVGLSSDAAEEANILRSVFEGLSSNERAILTRELNRSGVDDGWATLLDYAPAALANTQKAMQTRGAKEPLRSAAEVCLPAFARAFQTARTEIHARPGHGVFTLDISVLARQAAVDPHQLVHSAFELERVGADARLRLGKPVVVDASQFPVQRLRDLPGRQVVLVGMGGGSDGVQAAALGLLLQGAGKVVPAVISVREEKVTSQGSGGHLAQKRTVENAEEVAAGVFRITPESTSSGRFLENVPAANVPMYLVVDPQDDSFPERLKAAIQAAGGADTVIGVDTGGDALYVSGAEQEDIQATPDQDARTLEALSTLTDVPHRLTAIIATGVDAPSNAEAILQGAHATFWSPSSTEAEWVRGLYAKWQMDGSNPDRYGKTPLAWLAALSGEEGFVSIPLPTRVVLDDRNPWSPFVHSQPTMRGAFFMALPNHVQATQGR